MKSRVSDKYLKKEKKRNQTKLVVSLFSQANKETYHSTKTPFVTFTILKYLRLGKIHAVFSPAPSSKSELGNRYSRPFRVGRKDRGYERGGEGLQCFLLHF